MESAILVTAAICIFLSFYFSLLSFMTMEESLKRTLVLFATYTLLSSIIILGSLLIYFITKRMLMKKV